ncbi:amidohydrolase [Thalassobacillus sp. CUG 92003]|uniref:amidohydrolase n=1 Tax=Thalassobacillus sp. CUG 92003 TaxID=2736641 RepID=UPI0015E75179|nr:amidohydrolase [Thalassobacillus sp. CUG 92003]
MIVDNITLYRPFNNDHPHSRYHVEIKDGHIQAINRGRYQGVIKDVVDGGGAVMAPAFNDSHMHLLRYGLLQKELDLTDVSSWQEMKNAIETYYERLEEYDWVFGKGFNDDNFQDIDHLLTKEYLAEINVDKYMYFMHQDGHECVISSKAVDLLKNEKAFEREPEVFKEKNEKGEWNGRFKDTAVHYIKHHFWGRSVADAKEALRAALPDLSAHGITSVHTDDLNFIGSYEKLWSAYTELESEGALPIDVCLHHYVFDQHDLEAFLTHTDRQTGEGTNQVKVGAIKLFLDGTQRLHTAAMRNPYPEKPEMEGTLIYSTDEVKRMVRTASAHNMQVAMHAIGDRAVEQAISALEQMEANTYGLRHRIIHAQTLAPDLIQRMARLKPYIETQPSFLIGEWHKKANWTPTSLLPYCDPFNSLLSEHIPVTMSSDLPIGSLNPLETVFVAVNRTDLSHQPEQGWMPQEKISIDEAFRGFFTTPAELEFRERSKGKLAPGYQADFVLMDRHPQLVDPDELKDVRVLATYHRGSLTYSV